MAVAQGTKPAKKVAAPKKPSKGASSHPPYIDMITEALVSLKERTGSSHYAIAKHIEEQQKIKDLPPNFKKLLFIQIKRFVASGKLVKVKNSFKLPSATATKKSPSPSPSVTESKPKPKPKSVAEKKTKKDALKPKATTPMKKTVTKKTAAVKVKSPAAKKVAPAKAKKPKSIKSPAKKKVVASSKAKKAKK